MNKVGNSTKTLADVYSLAVVGMVVFMVVSYFAGFPHRSYSTIATLVIFALYAIGYSYAGRSNVVEIAKAMKVIAYAFSFAGAAAFVLIMVSNIWDTRLLERPRAVSWVAVITTVFVFTRRLREKSVDEIAEAKRVNKLEQINTSLNSSETRGVPAT